MVETACTFLIFLIATVQISMEYKAQESQAGYTKYLNSHKTKPYIFRCRVNQHLIVLNLYSVSINKILVTEFMTVRVCQKSLKQNKLTECKIFALKYGNRKLSNVWKYVEKGTRNEKRTESEVFTYKGHVLLLFLLQL